MACPQCHAAVGEHDRYCMQCGARVDVPATPAEPATSPSDDATDLSMPVGPSAAAEVELLACPSCGASNAARRRRCGRCEAPLRSVERVDTPPPEAVPLAPDLVSEPPLGPPVASPPPPGGRGHRRGVAVMVVVLGVLVGGGVGVAAGLGVGPFGDDGIARVAFDPQAYPEDPSVLPQVEPVASATRPDEGARRFVPALTADDDPTTSWQAVPSGGEPLRLRARFVRPTWVRQIEVVNGDQSSTSAFQDTARVAHARLIVGDELVVDATFLDQPGVQLVSLTSPVLADEITWEIDRWYGEPPVALSEVRYIGWTADDEDQAEFRSS